ncbi:WhiB family transcriptional regulator [Microbacterium sp. HMH0099]|uniref:WhiB family transcriptional regulator n=1 Tax=Microbacterium sp. HMH0099 TaxID=3414026 RepID=UPI003BF639EE
MRRGLSCHLCRSERWEPLRSALSVVQRPDRQAMVTRGGTSPRCVVLGSSRPFRTLSATCNRRARVLTPTHDRPSEDDVATMRAICASCPVQKLCQAYALAAKPQAGSWPPFG